MRTAAKCVTGQRRLRARRAATLLLAAAASLLNNTTMAASRICTFNGSASWNVASNWLGGLPGAADDAFISLADATNRTVTLDTSPTILSLQIGNSGSGTNTLSQTGAF